MEIRSMTGYGRGETKDGLSWTVEIKSVNHRFLEIYVRLPRPWLSLEDNIKTYVKKRISRGRIDVFVNLSSDALPSKIIIDNDLVGSFRAKLEEIKEKFNFEGPIALSLLSLMEGAFSYEQNFSGEEELWVSLVPALEAAMRGLVLMRTAEGENLGQDLTAGLCSIENKLAVIKERGDEVPKIYIQRLGQNLERLTPMLVVERERIEAEVAIMAERSCINEEIVRLSSHIHELRAAMNNPGLAGKKMDFIAQEMFREANTIASKASDYEITKEVIDIKSEIEKIREQIQNIE